jgi:hypothetical protein
LLALQGLPILEGRPQEPPHDPAREVLLQGSEWDVSEGPPGQERQQDRGRSYGHQQERAARQPTFSHAAAFQEAAEEARNNLNARNKVKLAFCTAFDKVALSFTTGLEHQYAQELSRVFLQLWQSPDNKQSPPSTYGATPSNNPTTTSRGPPTGTSTTPDPPRSWAGLFHNTPQQQQQQNQAKHGWMRIPQQPVITGRQPGAFTPAQQNPTPRSAPREAARTPARDERLFLRLDEQSPKRDADAFTIRKAIIQALNLDLADVPIASRTNTGWALRPANITVRQRLLTAEDQICSMLGAHKLEPAVKWFTYVVPGTSTRLTDLFGNQIQGTELYREEIIAQTGLNPVEFHWSRRPRTHPNHASLIVSFLTPVMKRFMLFNTSSLSRLIKKANPPMQCINCWDFHATRSCQRLQRCLNCGRTAHGDAESCHRPEQCPNCNGPHQADNTSCQARPYRKNRLLTRPSKEELKRIRQLSAEDYACVNATMLMNEAYRRTPSPGRERTPCPPPTFAQKPKDRPAGTDPNTDSEDTPMETPPTSEDSEDTPTETPPTSEDSEDTPMETPPTSEEDRPEGPGQELPPAKRTRSNTLPSRASGTHTQSSL